MPRIRTAETNATAAVQAEVISGDALTLSGAGKLFPTREGRGVTSETVWRWVNKGLRIDGQYLRLEACRCGTVIFTSRAAVGRFVAAQNGTSPAPVPSKPLPKPEVSSKSKRLTKEEMDAELSRLGL